MILKTTNIEVAFNSLLQYKTNAILAILGIVVAVASLIGIVSIFEGYKYNVEEQFQGIGANMLIITPYRPPGLKGRLLENVSLSIEDANILSYKIPNILHLSPIIAEEMIISFGNISYLVLVNGTNDLYPIINNHYVDDGRFFSKLDISQRHPVCVVGRKVIENLDIPPPVLGKSLVIKGSVLTICGILEKRGTLFGRDIDNQIIIPLETMKSLSGRTSQNNIMITALIQKITDVEYTEEQIRNMLRTVHRLSQDKPDDFKIYKQKDMVDAFDNIFTSLSLIAGGIAGISLVVGGIGIMNIMFSSVQERKKEIGIRRAAGATRKSILFQFLSEAVLISMFGGILGIMLGFMLTKFFLILPDFPEPFISLSVILISFGFTTTIGLIFGIVPAIKATRLNPIDAIRYE